MFKNNILAISTLVIVVVLGGWFFLRGDDNYSVIPIESPTPSVTISPLSTPLISINPSITPVPTSTWDGKQTFIDEPVPWELLTEDAFCRLQGEIKFLTHNMYDNQDAKFVYNGVDHPARGIYWTVTPDEPEMSIGPNLFVKKEIPNGESLIGIVLPDNPIAKTYELTAKIQYGRLVDGQGNYVTAGGIVKVFEKQCEGKTTIVLP